MARCIIWVFIRALVRAVALNLVATRPGCPTARSKIPKARKPTADQHQQAHDKNGRNNGATAAAACRDSRIRSGARPVGACGAAVAVVEAAACRTSWLGHGPVHRPLDCPLFRVVGRRQVVRAAMAPARHELKAHSTHRVHAICLAKRAAIPGRRHLLPHPVPGAVAPHRVAGGPRAGAALQDLEALRAELAAAAMYERAKFQLGLDDLASQISDLGLLGG